MTDWLDEANDIPEKMSDEIIRFFLENMTQENEEIFSLTLMDDFIFHSGVYMCSNFIFFERKLNKPYFHFDSVEESNTFEDVVYKFEATFDKYKKLRELSDNLDHLKEYYKLYGERVVTSSTKKLLEESNKILSQYVESNDCISDSVPECQRALYEQFLASSGPEDENDD